MPSTTTKTIAVDRELIVQTVAELQAAGEIAVTLDPNEDAISSHFWGVSQDLREAVFGRASAATDEEYQTNPLIVEIGARAREIAADVLGNTSDAIAGLRFQAERIRLQGSIDPTVSGPPGAALKRVLRGGGDDG